MKKRMRLNAVEMANPVQDNAGLWTYPGNDVSRYKELDYWLGLAKLLEKGKFDTLFFADILGVYDVYGASKDTSVKEGLYLPANDPSFMIPAMAAVTEHLSFALTASVTYENPYALARKMTTLDHLTKGRIGWNIVTSNLDSAAKNFGMTGQIPHGERYDRGDEYLDVCYKLWEKSWESDAVIQDKENRMYSDPSKVHDINHDGKYFKVPGIHQSEPSPQRTPVLFQAGSSERGREFAAKHAEAVFLNAQTVEETKFIVDDVRDRAEANGRRREDVLFFPKLNPVVAETEELAQAKLQSYLDHSSTEGALSLLSAWTGMDFSKFGAEELHAFIKKGEEKNGSSYMADFFGRQHGDKEWTIDELARYYAFGGIGSLVVGTPEQIADKMELFMDETGVDGFNIAYITRHETFEEFIDLVIPELQKRGRVQAEYQDGTFRKKLLGGDGALAPEHPGSKIEISNVKV